MKKYQYAGAIVLFAACCFCRTAYSDDSEVRQMHAIHAGFFFPDGMDSLGFSSTVQFHEHCHRYYTFGYPAIAALGISCYQDFWGKGWTASLGTGLGLLNQGNITLAYQWPIQAESSDTDTYVRLGVGYASSLIFNGAVPIIALEQRWK